MTGRWRKYRLVPALCAAAALMVPACTANAPDGGTGHGLVTGGANAVNAAASVRPGGTVTYTITAPITNWNVDSSSGATYSVIDVSSVLNPTVFMIEPDGSVRLNTAVVRSAEQTSASPQTVVYRINPAAKWSDGQPIDAGDFAYNWKVQDPRQCPQCEMANPAGYDRIRSVTGSDAGKTVTVVFDKPYVDWKSLFTTLLPAHVAGRYASIGTPAGLASGFNKGFATNVPTWSGGPYRIKTFTQDGSVVMVRNENWYGHRPSIDSIVFRLISAPAEQPTALANHEVNVISPLPTADLVHEISAIPDVKYQVSAAFQEHNMWVNLNAAAFKDRAFRQAVFEAVNVTDLVAKTIGQFDKTATPLKDHLFLPGQPGYQDLVSSLHYGVGDVNAAREVLRQAGYTGIGTKLVAPGGRPIPRMRFLVSANPVVNTEGQLIKAALAPLGVDVNFVPTTSALKDITQGNWDISVGTVTETAFSATSNQAYYSSCPKGEIFCGFNLGNYANPKVDELLNSSLSAASPKQALSQLQEANRLVAEDYAVLPLYQQRVLVAYSGDLRNVRNNSLMFPTYNSDQWGFAAK